VYPSPTLILPLPLGGGGYRWGSSLLLTSYFCGERRKVEERGEVLPPILPLPLGGGGEY